MTVAIPESGPGPVRPESDALPPNLVAEIKARFDRGEGCKHCGALHSRACPRVRRMAFHPTGVLAEVVFWPEGKWSDEHLIWPEDLTSGTQP